jgi:hypothetical protein
VVHVHGVLSLRVHESTTLLTVSFSVTASTIGYDTAI